MAGQKAHTNSNNRKKTFFHVMGFLKNKQKNRENRSYISQCNDANY